MFLSRARGVGGVRLAPDSPSVAAFVACIPVTAAARVSFPFHACASHPGGHQPSTSLGAVQVLTYLLSDLGPETPLALFPSSSLSLLLLYGPLPAL